MSPPGARGIPGRISFRASLVGLTAAVFGLLPAPALAAARHAADYPVLNVTFNSNDTVTVALPNGTPVGSASGSPTTIAPGTYDVQISDPTFVADIQWDLAGPGVSLVTSCSYGEESSETWVESFAPNAVYTWRDDNRPAVVYTFAASGPSVGTPGTIQAPSTSAVPIASGTNGRSSSSDLVGSQSVQPRGTVAGTVTPAGAIRLTFKGKPVVSVLAGRYVFSVTDDSKTAGLTVQEVGRPGITVTTGPFTGMKTLTVVLRAGQWLAYPSFLGKKTYFVVTS
jgi:hypothetical protein